MAAAAILNYKNFIFFGHVTVIGFNICCSIRNFIKVGRFLSRVSILTRGIDIANLSVCPSVRPSVHLSVRNVPVSDENGYGSPIILFLSASNLFTKFRQGHPLWGR